MWDLASGQELLILTGHPEPVVSVAWRPDGKLLATGTGDPIIRVWDMALGQELQTLKGHTGAVTSVA
jgi:WD40 repeat protein